MVFTLHRYVFRELMKIFILTSIALTLILSLGSVLRPIQEFGVGPAQVIHLIGYFLPITLTFVLPMAALFAASLVYGRLASDNELDACRASGISLWTLIYPGLFLAIITAIINLIFSFHVVPAYIQRAVIATEADAKQILFRNIQRKGYYSMPGGKLQIYADVANSKTNKLAGIVIVETKDKSIERIITAETAKIVFDSHRNFSGLKIIASNTYQIDDTGEASLGLASFTAEIESMLADDIKFKRIDEIKSIQADPMEFRPVAKLAETIFVQFTAELLAQDINKVTADSNDAFYRLHSNKRIIEFRADNCRIRTSKVLELTGNVIVLESDAAGKKPLFNWQANRARIYLQGSDTDPTLALVLYDANWQMPDGQAGIAQRPAIRGLIAPQLLGEMSQTQNLLSIIDPAVINSSLKNPSAILADNRNILDKQISRLHAKIQAEVHSRLVFGIGCISMILIGIGLGIAMKGGHLLSAFGASSIPAAALIVCIMMGKNITKNPGAAQALSGIALMWSSLLLLGLILIVIYRKLLKH